MNPPEATVPFQQLVETLLDKAVASGLEPPITFVLVRVNGYVSAVRYRRTPDGEWDRTLLVVGAEPPGKFPVSLIYCDMTGKSMFRACGRAECCANPDPIAPSRLRNIR